MSQRMGQEESQGHHQLTNNTRKGGNTTEPLTVEGFSDSSDETSPPNTNWFEAHTGGGRQPYAFQWDFGDGQQSDIANIHHTYENPGNFTAAVTVTDAVGQTASDGEQISLSSPTGNDEKEDYHQNHHYTYLL